MAAVAVSVVVVPQEVGKMMSPAERFLTVAEQDQVTAVVREVEKTTSGEIAPMIVSRSHGYPMAAAMCSTLLSLPLALLLTDFVGSHIWIGRQNIWMFLLFFIVLYAPIYTLALRTDRMKRYFLNQRLVESEVQEAALAAFYSEGLYKTKDENGILLFISILEQKVWILADSGINKKIDKAEWDTVVTDLIIGIKSGERCEAMCAAIRRIGQILQTHFPYQENDRDELHNLIIR